MIIIVEEWWTTKGEMKLAYERSSCFGGVPKDVYPRFETVNNCRLIRLISRWIYDGKTTRGGYSDSSEGAIEL